MNIPKVEFKIAKPSQIIGLINFFLNPKKGDWDWSHFILNKYPNLRKKLSKVKDKEKRKKITKNFFENLQIKEILRLEESKTKYQKVWDRINNSVMIALSKVVEQEWSEKDKKIFARVSLCPINPRYIKSRTFDVFYKTSIFNMKAISIHEILHFLYFEKWKKVFPKTKEKEFDAPYLVWQLSEMVPKIILNDKLVQKVFKHKFDSYKEYENFKLNGKPLLSYLQDFYDNKKDFADFLKKSWKFVQKYEKEMNSI